MPVKKYKILLKQNSQLNKKIINYFKQNLSELNSKRVVFEWLAVYEEEEDYYEEQGIDKFPTLIINNNNISGVSNIITTLNDFINSSKNPIQPSKQKKVTFNTENEDEMHDFLLNELKSNESNKDEDDRDNISSTISQRAAEMSKARTNGGKKRVISNSDESDDIFLKTDIKISPVKNTNSDSNAKPLTTSELIKQTTKGNDEDKMMSKFWENQEETEM
jgi:glutaredoxin